MDTVKIGSSDVSRFILGSNSFSGFSGRGREGDLETMHYWTCARIKDALREAESLGINTIIARGNRYMLRVLLEYWDEGGTIQWFGQSCPELGVPERTLDRVAAAGAPACHIHGGYADRLLADGRAEELIPSVEHARKLGLTIGLAGHRPDTFRWAEENLEVDYYMCSYYAGTREPNQEHRRAMTELIQSLSRPAIHYKVMAAGRNEPAEAFEYVARSMRPQDAVCVGIYTKDKPDILREDVELLEQGLAART